MISRRCKSILATPCSQTLTPGDSTLPLCDSVGARSRRRAFTLIELLWAIAIIAVLIGLISPGVQRARYAAQFQQSSSDLTELHKAMEAIFEKHGDYPLSITDPRFVDPEHSLLSDGLVAKIHTYVDVNHHGVPYFIVSVRQGKAGERDTWDYRIGTSQNFNPINDPAPPYAFDPGATVDPAGVVAHSNILPDGTYIYPNETSEHYWWPWGKPVPPPTQISIQDALMTARAAEIVTPMIEAHPEIASQIRPFLMMPETTTLVLQQFTPAWFAPFSDIMPLDADDIAALADMDLTMLPGNPAFLFSYDALRMLSTVYSDDAGVADGLRAKLDAAEDSEANGNLKAKQGQLKAFTNQVRAQSGKALSADHARVLLALSKAL